MLYNIFNQYPINGYIVLYFMLWQPVLERLSIHLHDLTCRIILRSEIPGSKLYTFVILIDIAKLTFTEFIVIYTVLSSEWVCFP